MDLFKLFRKQSPNALIILEKSNEQLQQLLFLEKQHTIELLAMLKEALQNKDATVSKQEAQPITKEPGEPTPREKDILKLFQTNNTVSSQELCTALGYACRQVASKHLSNMLRKGLIAKTGTGKNIRYKKV